MQIKFSCFKDKYQISALCYSNHDGAHVVVNGTAVFMRGTGFSAHYKDVNQRRRSIPAGLL